MSAQSTEAIEAIRRVVVPVLRPYASRICLFGSFARGEQVEASDVDLLVTLRPPDERPPLGLRWFGLERDLEDSLHRRVEMVEETALSPYLREAVTREQVTLYEE